MNAEEARGILNLVGYKGMSKEECEALILGTCLVRDKNGGASEEEIHNVLEWALEVRTNNAILESALSYRTALSFNTVTKEIFVTRVTDEMLNSAEEET